MTAHLQNSIYVGNFSVLFQTYGSFMNEIGKKLLLMTFLIRRSTYNNSLNCVTVLNSHRVILMEQLIPFIEWRGFALEFRLLISFFIGAYFTERGLYFDFDVWTSKEGDIFKEKKISKLHTYYDSKYFVNILMLIDWGFQLWYIFKHRQKEEKSLHHACFTKFYFAAQCDTVIRDSVVIFSCWIWEMKLGTILCYIVIATVLFLLLGFISLVFFPIFSSSW